MSNDQDFDGMAEQALNRFTQHTGEKPVVLIADDSRVVRVSLRNILNETCQLIEVEDGEQAWQVICQTPSIDLVFSDLSMPKLNGRKLLTNIRNSTTGRISNLPFIVVTGNEVTDGIAEELEKLGASGMVSKPFDPTLIQQFVDELAEESEQELSVELQNTKAQSDYLDSTTDKSQFLEIASRELSFAIRNKNELALAIIKVDQFSSILDHYSEAAIEHILLALKEIIDKHIHPDDTLGYFGEGCFAILRPASNAIGTKYLSRRILEDLTSKQFYLGEADESVTASIGISAPDIKPGIRLQDLIKLAEGRLKAAFENGGDKVVDKGNENLTPVSMQDSMEISNVISNTQPSSPHVVTRSSSEINRLAAEQVAEIKAKYTNQTKDFEAQAGQISEYKRALEDLTDENRALIEDVKHWKNESAEAEHLRRQLFEVESQFQQLKVKFGEVQKAKEDLAHRTDTTERENRRLIDEEEERTASLRQSHQLIEGENKRLESQIIDLKSRAEKAELESLKSNQLVTSLRDNSNLLKMQVDQLQQEVDELREKQYQQPQASKKQNSAPSSESDSELKTDTDLLEELYKPELALSPTPQPKPKPQPQPQPQLQSQPVKESTADSVHLFPDKEQVDLKQKQVKESRIPPFRVEAEPMFFKNGFNLSSFTIASLIMLAIVVVGGIYLYAVMGDPPANDLASKTNQVTLQSKTPNDAAAAPAPKETVVKKSVNNGNGRSAPSVNRAGYQEAAPVTRAMSISEELRLEKELTLRQMAEEEFSRSLVSTATTEPVDSDLTETVSSDFEIQSETANEALPLPQDFEAEATSVDLDATTDSLN
ncbi:MAG: response regulator [Candidatus Thiodiazotropha endolucinida]|nr:response regulator [Candidatus Thiodiazotropha taylori]MCW4321726.1 response regulator [Candidatus Thiodiazotropha taylori]